jgi:hypothetical protein
LRAASGSPDEISGGIELENFIRCSPDVHVAEVVNVKSAADIAKLTA